MSNRTFALFSIVASCASGGVAAQPVTGLYVNLGAGVDLLQNEIVKPYNGYGPTKRAYRFDPGPAIAVAGGYGLGNGLRLEVEGDYANSHVRGVKLGQPERAGGHEQQYGGFVNALYDFSVGLPVFPYLGAGIGYQEVELDGINSGQASAIANSHRTESQGAFAYQAIAGLSYPLSVLPGLSLTTEYRFIGVLTPPAFDRGSSNGNTLNGVPLVPRATFGNIFNHEILFGVRYAFNAAPPAVLAPEVPTPGPSAVRTYLVFFDWDRAELTDRARQIVAQAAQATTHLQVTRIEVSGHTDTSGTATYNQGLSLRRAQNVAAELVRQGVPSASITTRGLGFSRPLVLTGSGVREPQNRRVEIVLR